MVQVYKVYLHGWQLVTSYHFDDLLYCVASGRNPRRQTPT